MASGMTYDNRILLRVKGAIPELLDRFVGEAAQGISGDIVDILGGPSPSSPGEPPGEDTGNLRANISVAKVGHLSWVVYSPTKYAPYLEFGTEHMAKRPFFVPIFEEWRQRRLMEFARKARLVE